MGVQLPSEPITRKEQYLAKAAGQAVEIPAEPITREEAYLDYIAKHGGGGGGTTNYNNLENLPQIGGVTLQGNKTASDLGLVAAVDGKGLSTNDYTDADKAIVGGVTDALAGKQDELTAGNYVSITNDGTINVTKAIGVYDLYSYKIEGRNGGGNYWTNVIKSVNGVQVSSDTYSNTQAATAINIDDMFTLRYGLGTDSAWHFKLLADSNEHQAGEEITWKYNETKDFTETFNVSQDSSTDLATKGDVTAALATKVDKVEGKGLSTNDYSDTEKAQVATNASDISSLKSGLTNLDYLKERVIIGERRENAGNVTFNLSARGAGLALITQNGYDSSIYILSTHSNGTFNYQKLYGTEVTIDVSDMTAVKFALGAWSRMTIYTNGSWTKAS